MNSNVDLQKLVFHKVVRVSRVEFDRDTGEFTAAVNQEMREGLAHHIQHAKIEKEFNEFYVEARLDLYVATPAEFWNLVNFQAERIANRFSRTVIERPARKATHWFVKFNNGHTCYVRTQVEADNIKRKLDVDESITPLYE